jgi:UDP-N-acetylglucosamine--N-acetylmuramyl-(pentapeptide) pyrophosphoryl-undecaprenol N-acetylglucosamine transferase
MNHKTICCVAGKSGGHIIPCLTVVQQASSEQPLHVLFFSANTPMDNTILAHNPLVSWHVTLPLTSRNKSLFILMWHTLYSFVSSFFHLCKHKPKKLITTGGIVAIPPCIAAFLLRIPITLYSLDAVPGKAICALVPFATTIITPFASSAHYFPTHKCSVAPYPIKYQTATIDNDDYAIKQMGLSPAKKTVLILGGSQGSLFLNNYVKQWINTHLFDKNALQIIHQTGSLDTTDWQTLYASKNITAHVFSYHPNLATIYMAADIIVCRAGAGTLFEIKFFNKQCIIIPLMTNTTSHQVDNAHAIVAEYPELFCSLAQTDVEKNPLLLHNLVMHKLFSQQS